MAEFSPSVEIGKIPALLNEFFEQVLHDEDPLFVSDEAKIWDVSVSTPEELLERCCEYYQVPVTLDDFGKPLWQLLRLLDRRRSKMGLRHSR